MLRRPNDLYKVILFFKKVSVQEVKEFCEKNGFYIHIYSSGYIELRRYPNGFKQVL